MAPMSTSTTPEAFVEELNHTYRTTSPNLLSTADAIRITLFSIDNTLAGDDLRQWTPKARRALQTAGAIHCMVGKEGEDVQTFIAPKLALLVASPVLRKWIIAEPNLREIHFADAKFTPPAVGVLCYWLTSICGWSSEAVPYLPCPRDLFLALEVQHAARLLCMDKYVGSIDTRYLEGIWHRIPSLDEAVTIGNYTLQQEDPVLSVWASRVAHLRRIGHPSCQSLAYLDDELGVDEHEKLLDALDEADASFHTKCFRDRFETAGIWPLGIDCVVASPTP